MLIKSLLITETFEKEETFYKHNIFLLDSIAKCHQKNVWEKHNSTTAQLNSTKKLQKLDLLVCNNF